MIPPRFAGGNVGGIFKFAGLGMEIFGGVNLACFLLEEAIQTLSIAARTAEKEGDLKTALEIREMIDRRAGTMDLLADILGLWPRGPGRAWATYAAAASRMAGLNRVQPRVPKEETATVEKVIDGDTFATETGVTIRIFGINAPELTAPGGEAAKAKLAELIEGQTVRLVVVRDVVDTFGRHVRQVFKGNLDVGEEMVATGHAERYTYRGRALSPEKRAALRPSI